MVLGAWERHSLAEGHPCVSAPFRLTFMLSSLPTLPGISTTHARVKCPCSSPSRFTPGDKVPPAWNMVTFRLSTQVLKLLGGGLH